MNLSNPYIKLALVLAGAYAAYKYSGSSMVKTAAVAIGSLAVAKQVPVLNTAI